MWKSHNLLNRWNCIVFLEIRRAPAFFFLPSFYFLPTNDISIQYQEKAIGFFFFFWQIILHIRSKTSKPPLPQVDLALCEQASHLLDRQFSFYVEPHRIQDILQKNEWLAEVFKNHQGLNRYTLHLIKEIYKQQTFELAKR